MSYVMKNEFTTLVFLGEQDNDSSLPTVSPDNVFSTIKRKIGQLQKHVSKSISSVNNSYRLFEIRSLENLYSQITSDFDSSNFIELSQLVESF